MTDLVEELERREVACVTNRVRRSGPGQLLARTLRREQAGQAPSGHHGQHGVQPTDRLGAPGGEIVMAFRQQAQHRRVGLGGDDTEVAVAHPHNRRRASIVTVVLVRASVVKEPHPRRELRWHVDDPLTVSDQPLRELPADASRALDRPPSRWPPPNETDATRGSQRCCSRPSC